MNHKLQSLLSRLTSSTDTRDSALTVSQADIDLAGLTLGIEWPEAYSQFVRAINNIEFATWDILRVCPHGANAGDRAPNEIVAHNRWLHEKWSLPRTVIAFCTDGLGNADCFDTRERPRGSVKLVRFNHEQNGDLEDGPADFEEWLAGEVETLEWLKQNP